MTIQTSTAGRQVPRIAVVGTGWWSTRVHLPALLANKGCEVVAVADADPARGAYVAGHFHVPHWYPSHRLLLDEVKPDGIVVATPPDTHHAIARDCLLAGADVLVEKPMTTTTEEARDLVRVARHTGRRLHVGYPYPYSRLAQSLRDTVAAGGLGELRLVSGMFATSTRLLYQGKPHIDARDALFAPDPATYSDIRRGGGQMHSQVTHVASLLFFVTGLRPDEVQAFVGRDSPEADSWDALCFRTQTSAVGTIASTATVAHGSPRVERIELFGDHGHATYDMGRGTLSIRFYDGRTLDDEVASESERYPRAATSERLVAALRGEAGVLVGGDLGLLTTAFICAALNSVETGRPIKPYVSGCAASAD